jgi:hypothetical protein
MSEAEIVREAFLEGWSRSDDPPAQEDLASGKAAGWCAAAAGRRGIGTDDVTLEGGGAWRTRVRNTKPKLRRRYMLAYSAGLSFLWIIGRRQASAGRALDGLLHDVGQFMREKA